MTSPRSGAIVETQWNELNGKTAPLCHYIIVRADLSPGQMVAQAVHAAGESASPRPTPGCIAVALVARDEAHLRELSAGLEAYGLAHHLVIEDDGQLMAIGLQPTRDRATVRKVLSSLPLVR